MHQRKEVSPLNKHHIDPKQGCDVIVYIKVNDLTNEQSTPRPVFVYDPHDSNSREKLKTGHTYKAMVGSDGWFIFYGMQGKGMTKEKLEEAWHNVLVEVKDSHEEDYFEI